MARRPHQNAAVRASKPYHKIWSATAGTLLLAGEALLAGGPTPPTDLNLQPVVSGLSNPVGLTHAGDGSGRLFIIEQDGVIRIYDPGTDALLPTPFLDITTLVDSSQNEQGLLGLAFDPNYGSNGYFFVYYTMDPGPGLDRTRVVRYSVSAGDANVADDTSAHTIIEIEQDSWNHNGGDLHFSPADGYLYVGMGDGGGTGDPNNRAQTSNQLLGKMLRIDPHEGAGGAPECGVGVQNYTIPASNPFVDGAGGYCDEIWQVGLRNPWRWSFDRATGDLIIGDVGQFEWEEINFAFALDGGGENFGWRCYEGDGHPYNTAGCAPVGTYDPPVMEYSSGGGSGQCSVVGGYRYRGPSTNLYDFYVFADYCSGQIWYAEGAGPATWQHTVWGTAPSLVSAFGEDEEGHLYVVLINSGSVLRLDLSDVFSDGFESGDTTLWN